MNYNQYSNNSYNPDGSLQYTRSTSDRNIYHYSFFKNISIIYCNTEGILRLCNEIVPIGYIIPHPPVDGEVMFRSEVSIPTDIVIHYTTLTSASHKAKKAPDISENNVVIYSPKGNIKIDMTANDPTVDISIKNAVLSNPAPSTPHDLKKNDSTCTSVASHNRVTSYQMMQKLNKNLIRFVSCPIALEVF